MKTISQSEHDMLHILLRRLIPETPNLPIKPEVLNITDHMLQFMAEATPLMKTVFHTAIWSLKYSPIWRKGRLKTFAGLSPTAQEQLINHWLDDRFYPSRMIFKSLSMLAYSLYYSNQQVEHLLDFRPAPRLPKHELDYAVEDGATIDHPVTEFVDVCIIGSGAGGATMAKELSEKGLSVLVIEEGSLHKTGDFNMRSFEMLRKLYRDDGLTFTVGFPSILLPLGKCVGGTTVINSGSCFRLPEKVLWKWQQADATLKGLSYEELAHYFDRVESIVHVATPPLDLLSASNRRFKSGADSLGYSGGIIPRNIHGCEGSGFCCFGCPTGGKQSMQLSYLPLAVKNGARIYARSRVERILTENGKATGVQASFIQENGQRSPYPLTVKAKVTVVACGTIHTPRLLMKSGLNFSPVLGQCLTLHPAAKVSALFSDPIHAHQGIPQGYYVDQFHDQGIMMEGIDTPPGVSAVSVPIHGMAHKQYMEHYSHLASFGLLVSDTSRGRIWAGHERPWVTYFLNKRDCQTMVTGLSRLADIFFEAGAKEVYLPIAKYPHLRSREDIRQLENTRLKPTDLDLSAFHPLGTCRMGSESGGSVINGYGQVHGVDNLYIADGSIFPTALGVNPQMTIMAFATRTADHIAEHYFS